MTRIQIASALFATTTGSMLFLGILAALQSTNTIIQSGLTA